MRTLFLALTVVALATSGCTQPEAPAPVVEATPAAFNVEGQPTVEYDVPGLHCDHCSATACKLLADVDGVVDVKADPVTKKAVVAIDESTFDAAAAVAALEGQFGEATVVGDEVAAEDNENAS